MITRPSFMSQYDYVQAILLAKNIILFERKLDNLMKNRSELEFDVYFEEENRKWAVPTLMCSYGGCYMGIHYFETEVEATKKAAELTLLGYKLKTTSPCPDCHREYMET